MIGENIKKRRKEKGMKQEDLGDLLGVKAAMISQWERGERNPKEETLMKIAKALDTDIYVLTDTYPPFDHENDFRLKETLFVKQVAKLTIEEKDALMSALVAALDETVKLDNYFSTNDYTHRLSNIILQCGQLLWSARRGDYDFSFNHLASLNILFTEYIKKADELLKNEQLRDSISNQQK